MFSGRVIEGGSLLHFPWVKDKVKTNEVSIRVGLAERGSYFCLNSLFLCFSQLASVFGSPPTVRPIAAPRRLPRWHGGVKHTLAVSEQRDVTGPKVARVLVSIWMTTESRITTLLCILMLFCCHFRTALSVLLVLSLPSFEKTPFVSLLFKLSQITEVKLPLVNASLLTCLSVFFFSPIDRFMYKCLLSSARSRSRVFL